MSTAWSRGKADQLAGSRMDDTASLSAGVRERLDGLPEGPGIAAAFDTRLPNALAGGAARPIAKHLGRRGRTVLDSVGFIVDDGQGPLHSGELDRARRWGAALVPEHPVPVGAR